MNFGIEKRRLIMNTKMDSHNEKRIELNGMLAEFRAALEEEIEKIKRSGQSSTLLHSGRRAESSSPEFWYRFYVEYIPSLPADTPCKLFIGKDQFDVTVISFEENSIIISSKNLLPDTIGNARLENGATVLMELLIKRIEENAEKHNPTGKRMLPNDGNEIYFQKNFNYDDVIFNPKNTERQNEAVMAAISNDITYIWGPPGTGKTMVIGQIINELYKHNRSVLVVSHTNTAVDGAIEHVDKIYSNTYEMVDKYYPILRIGIPARPLPDRMLLNSHVEALGKDLYEQKVALETQQDEIEKRINAINTLFAKYSWCEKNQLSVIYDEMQEILRLEKQAKEGQHAFEELVAAIQEQKVSHPEYEKYFNLLNDFNLKSRALETLRLQLTNAEELVNEAPFLVQSAKDEVKKHLKYVELRQKESKIMSEQFLRGEISKAAAHKMALNTEIQTLTIEGKVAQQTLDDYEKKNSVAKFFSGKNANTQAQSRLSEITVRLPQANEELQRQNKLEQLYQAQLEELLFLQEQIKSVIPSKTKDYWENKIIELTRKLTEAKIEIPAIRAKEENVSAELDGLEKTLNLAKKAYSIIQALETEIQGVNLARRNLIKEINIKNNACSELIKRECSLCEAFFYTIKSDKNKALHNELSSLLDTVRLELSTIDIPALVSEKSKLETQLIDIHHQLNVIKQKMLELEKQAIMNAKIVGATLVKSYLSDTLRERSFDTVILDEASMASIPALWCASYLAEKNIVIVGDFLQLPPIVMADAPMAQEWLGKDIFSHHDMPNLIKKNPPENFIMLKDQYRMESEIAKIANIYYGEYGGLISHDDDTNRNVSRNEFYSWYSGKRTDHCIHLIDTESLHAWVTGVRQGNNRHSRLNCFSAAVVVDLSFKFLEKKLTSLNPTTEPAKNASVLIVAPYKPHIARIKQLIDLEYKNRGFKDLNYISAGTIHSFQGSEADIVIFDLVVDEPHWKANLFMTDKKVNDDLRKMFNVAITRAKFKLYIVGNFAYCQRRAKNNALSELLDELINKNRLVKYDAKKLLPNIAFSMQRSFISGSALSNHHIVCLEESFNEYFMADIQSFNSRLIIYSPFISENRLSVLLPYFADAVNNGKQIIIVTKAPSDRGKTELTQYKQCEKELSDIGVSVIYKKGMHEKLIFVDDLAVWVGSLNALSFTGLTGEIMHRHKDKTLTAEYENLFGIEHICGAAERIYEQACPICGAEMLVKESDSGGIYWECVNGDYSRNAEQQYPIDGIMRCKCGASFIFSMKNQPRWVCSENSSHYQKMRQSDLKLEKMAALIPTKIERREVDRYFAEKRKEREVAKVKSGAGKKYGTKKSMSSKTKVKGTKNEIKSDS